jgi:16S rRNA (uracil1498-N3)-methyltransferase
MRQFIFNGKTEKNGSIIVSGKDYRYLMTVLRLKINDRIDVRLKNGELVLMEISSCNGKTAVLNPIAREKEATGQGVSAFSVENQATLAQSKEIWLFQFMPKPQKMDLIIRQATECGVSIIVPIVGDFSVNQDGKGRLERWDRIVKEARQQSGSPVSTKVLEPVSVERAADSWAAESSKEKTKAFILHEDGEQAKDLSSILKSGETPKKIALAVGCEGGFSQKEFEKLKQVGFLPLHFNTNVLRAETAALYGIAVLQQVLYL